jgi:hypothetical protein
MDASLTIQPTMYTGKTKLESIRGCTHLKRHFSQDTLAINHTCHPGFANCRFVHTGIVGGWSEDEPGGIAGRHTSEVFVKTTRRGGIDAELFTNYGTKFRFAGGCVCHLCRPFEP